MNIIRIRDLNTELTLDNNKLIAIDDNSYITNAKKISVGTLGQYVASFISVLYSNTGITSTSIGGIPAGSTFSGKTMQYMWDKLLYPEQSTSFSAFTFQFNSGPLEIGYSFPSDNALWTTSIPSIVSPNSIQISGDFLTTLTGLVDDGSEALTFTGSVVRTSVGSKTWIIQAQDSNLICFFKTLNINWYWKLYWGNSSGTTVTNPIALSNSGSSITNTCVGNYTFAGGNYKYFFIETISQGSPVLFKDQSTNFNIAMNLPYIQSVTNSYGQTINYNVYRSTNKLNGDVVISIS